LKVENGVTPDGQEYDAVAGELRATHVALAPHVRDPENKIRVTNAVCINSEGEIMEVKNGDLHLGEVKNSRGEILNIKEYSMDPKELAALVKNAVDEAIAEKNSDDRMGAMEETLKAHGDALNEINEKLSPKAESENKETPEEEKKEAATLENAKPSQEMVKAFSTALNVDFGAKTPSFATLAALSGIAETDPALRIAAVNTKFAEMQKNAPKENQAAAAQNATAGEVF